MKSTSKTFDLTEKEKLFCCNYINNGNVKESAIKAGYSSEPEKAGIKLLAKQSINDEIARLYSLKKKNLVHKAHSGYERLAFGSISDAVRLLFSDNPNYKTLQSMDLFNISEIKKLKDGGLEIKFFDRLRAMDKLQESGLSNESEALPFYRALEEGAKAITLKNSREQEE